LQFVGWVPIQSLSIALPNWGREKETCQRLTLLAARRRFLSLSLEFGDAKGDEEGIGEAKVIGVFNKVTTIPDSERGHVNGLPVEVIDETLAEAEGKVGREIDVSGLSFGEVGLDEASEMGPSPRQTLPVSDTYTATGRGRYFSLGFSSFFNVVVGVAIRVEMKGDHRRSG
jgi:hypothetical protein